MAAAAIPPAEYASRRSKVLTRLRGSIALVFAGDHDTSALHEAPYRPHPHFEYLTGVVDEPGAVLLLDPAHPVAARRAILFLRPLNPEIEQWDGLREPIGSALRAATGFSTVFRTIALGRWVREAAVRARSAACLHPLAAHTQPVSPDLAVFKKLAERIPGFVINDKSDMLATMRSVKSRAEISMLQKAVDVTREGFLAAMRATKPGLNEFDVQEAVEHAYRTNGSRGPAFGTIIGSGINSCVLHYRDNRDTIEKGDLICIDSGAAWGGYGGDITRTIPASGRFTKRQREIYDLVLKAQKASIRAVKPGATFAQIDKAARTIINKAGFADAFMHGIGHHLGLETHDINPDTPLRQGAVITIEPGIYLPDEKLGVRIEDDVVVTKTGCRNLATKIPKTAADVEAAMKG